METLKETFQRLITHYNYRLRKNADIINNSFRFYRNLSFLKKDVYRARLYRKQDAFSVSNNYEWKENSYGLHIYGETPLSTMDKIARTIGLSSSDTVFDLGSSTGKTTFFLNEFYGCKVIGVELNPEFHNKACQVLDKYPTPGVTFLNKNLFDIDYSEATVVYCYCTGLKNKGIERFLEALSTAKKGTKIITVSVPLEIIDKDTTVTQINEIKGYYYWGYASVYIYAKL